MSNDTKDDKIVFPSTSDVTVDYLNATPVYISPSASSITLSDGIYTTLEETDLILDNKKIKTLEDLLYVIQNSTLYIKMDKDDPNIHKYCFDEDLKEVSPLAKSMSGEDEE